ncbi:unnamed protein product [Rotaria socialis]|uniref:Uncharacterized protein n=2 Tax=Rotaria socialis TaxID=392032 RepID=A0A820HAJ2_9BILA|nr:unnamed protein product [Rotaria socialis]CAF4469861.1 unnamed protein product [Rotaria socialis]
MAASQSGLNFISSRAEAIKVPTDYHKITALRLKAYTIISSMGSSRSALISSRNSVQDCLNPICENDCDQPSDFFNENLFSHL